MPKNTILISISFLVLLAIIFLWWPKYQEFSDARIKLRERKIELENKDKYFAELSQLAQKLQEYSSQLALLDAALPQQFGAPDLLDLLSKESSQNGLVLQKVDLGDVSPLEKESEIFKLPVSFSVSGTYPSFKSFLQALQKNARFIEIESISFSSPQKGDVFSFDLIIRVHSY